MDVKCYMCANEYKSFGEIFILNEQENKEIYKKLKQLFKHLLRVKSCWRIKLRLIKIIKIELRYFKNFNFRREYQKDFIHSLLWIENNLQYSKHYYKSLLLQTELQKLKEELKDDKED